MHSHIECSEPLFKRLLYNGGLRKALDNLYADKFFSKTHPEVEKSINEAEKSLVKFGEDGLKRFKEWEMMFE